MSKSSARKLLNGIGLIILLSVPTFWLLMAGLEGFFGNTRGVIHNDRWLHFSLGTVLLLAMLFGAHMIYTATKELRNPGSSDLNPSAEPRKSNKSALGFISILVAIVNIPIVFMLSLKIYKEPELLTLGFLPSLVFIFPLIFSIWSIHTIIFLCTGKKIFLRRTKGSE